MEGATCRETVLSNMRNEAARLLEVQALRGTQASCRILCVASHARACTGWHATMQHVRVIGVGVSRRSQSEPTRAAFAQPPPERARASHCRGRSTRNSGNNRTESQDERAGNTWRDGVIGEGRNGRSQGPCASDASRVRPPREHRRHIPLHVPVV